MSKQWFKIKFLISIKFSDLTVQNFFTRNSLLRITRINFIKIVVSLYTSWLHFLRARSTLSYHTVVHQPHIKTKEKNWDLLKVMKKSLEITKLIKSISNDEVLMSFDSKFSSSIVNWVESETTCQWYVCRCALDAKWIKSDRWLENSIAIRRKTTMIDDWLN